MAGYDYVVCVLAMKDFEKNSVDSVVKIIKNEQR